MDKRPPAAWRGALAWVVIVGICVLSIAALRPAAEPEDGADPVGLVLTQLQSKYLVGVARILPANAPVLYDQADAMLNLGTVPQRQRFVVLAAEMAGLEEARSQLEKLDLLIASPPVGPAVELSETQASVQRILHELYAKESAETDDPPVLSNADRDLLVRSLGWFGELALAADDTPQRGAVLRSAVIVAVVLFMTAMLGMLGGFAGFVGLILLVVFTLTGRLKSGLGPPRPYHVIYAETFAVWAILFLGLQELLAVVPMPASLHFPLVFAVFASSLAALVYPVLQGIPWRVVRADVGLLLGPRPWLEPFVGVAGYLCTLPILAVGVLMTFLLMTVQGVMAGEQPTFAPAGGPAHPVVAFMSGPDIWLKLQILVLAAVAAPIVEETMFRGVLYRHLRDASAGLGLVASVLLSAAFNGFLFAAIHPQGFVAIPALMALALGMALLREWRGSLVPSMVMHGFSNGLIMLLLLIVLGV